MKWSCLKYFNIIRIETLQSIKQIDEVHFSSSHIVYKPNDPMSRWCIDGSNRYDDAMPLNGGTAKDLSINHYQKTVFPTLLEILVMCNNIKVADNLPWYMYCLVI